MKSLLPGGVSGFHIAEESGGSDALFSEFVFVLVFSGFLTLDSRRFWRTKSPSRVSRVVFAVAAAFGIALWWYVAADQLYLSRLKFHLVFSLAALFELPGLMHEVDFKAERMPHTPLAFCYACAATYFQPPYWWTSIILATVPSTAWVLENRHRFWFRRKPVSHFD